MRAKNIRAITLLFTVGIFVSFNYIPVIINVSGLENERQILLQVIKKDNEFEHMVSRREIKPKEAEKYIHKEGPVTKPLVQAQKKIKGNRGFLIKDARPTTP
jgi:hypothetical protein